MMQETMPALMVAAERGVGIERPRASAGAGADARSPWTTTITSATRIRAPVCTVNVRTAARTTESAEAPMRDTHAE